MAVQTGSQCKFYVGPANTAADDVAAYDALSYTLVGEVSNISEFGDTFNEVNFTALADGRVRKLKGSKNAGTITVEVGLDPSDTGQDAVQTAVDAASSASWEYAWKVELNDSAGTNPTTYYFRGLGMQFTKTVGGADDIVTGSIMVGINSAIVEKAAA